jgi:four helix bundle protein
MELWTLARSFNLLIYGISGAGRFARDFGLRDQIRRAAVSIASNIAEGFESQSNPTFIRFLSIARGSSAEVRAQLYLALDLGYVEPDDIKQLICACESISRQLTGLISYLATHNRP